MRFWLLLGGLLACRTTLSPDLTPPEEEPAAAWGEVLGRVVDEAGQVDYEALSVQRAALDRYVAWIGSDGIMRRRGGEGGHAFWLNAFNALALYQVLERGRPASIREVRGLPSPGWGFFFWTDFRVGEGPPLSLWEIAHEKVILAHQDYRSFAALSFPARSAPPLSGELYRPGRLRAQLDARFSAWMESDQGVRRDEDGSLWFNAIFHRYEDELALFTNHADLCTLAARHTSGPRRRLLRTHGESGCAHGWLAFDWALNDQGGR